MATVYRLLNGMSHEAAAKVQAGCRPMNAPGGFWPMISADLLEVCLRQRQTVKLDS